MTDRARAGDGRSFPLVVFITGIFVVIALLTNVNGPLMPAMIKQFDISLTMAAFIPFSFFLAYGVLSIPTGMVIERVGDKVILLAGFALALVGTLLFAIVPAYVTALLSLFLIGLGVAALQVSINPLLRVAGGEEHYAFYAVLVQAIFGLASFLAPHVYERYGVDIEHVGDPIARVLVHLVPADLAWVSVYWILAAATLITIVAIALWPLPRVERRDDERVGAIATHVELLRKPVVWAYFVGIFAYVGLEQGLANWMSQFLETTHGFDPETAGASAVANFWLLMMFGAFLGSGLLKVLDSKRVLLMFGVAALVMFTTAMFGSADVSRYAFMGTGFAISVMWPVVFSLALNSLDKHHGTFSGILCTGIVGGAIVPLLIGLLGDHFGLRFGMCFLYLPLLYILSVSVWAKPLVTNKTLGA